MPSVPTVAALFIATAKGQPMQRVERVQAIAGKGLQEDRYATGTGYYSARYDCEVTLIEGEVLDVIESEDGLDLHQGQHRRNIVTSGLSLRNMEGCRLRLGEVLLEYHRPRPPCDYLQRITQPGVTRALGRGAGIGVRVLIGGWLHEGMEMEVIEVKERKRVLP